MSVIHLETGRNLYGGALQMLYLVQGLQERGVSSVVLAPKGSEVPARHGRVGCASRSTAFAVKRTWCPWREWRGASAVPMSNSSISMGGRGADTLGLMAATMARAPAV